MLSLRPHGGGFGFLSKDTEWVGSGQDVAPIYTGFKDALGILGKPQAQGGLPRSAIRPAGAWPAPGLLHFLGPLGATVADFIVNLGHKNFNPPSMPC